MTRPFKFLFLVLLGTAGATAALAIFAAACAHAADAPPVLVAPVDPTTTVVAWVGAILGGLSMLLTIAFQVLKVIAPLTKTPIDDEIRDGIGEILDHVRGQSSSTVVVPRTPQSGRVTVALLYGLYWITVGALVLVAGGMLVTGCGARPRIAAGVGAFLDCESPHVDAQMLADAKVVATSAIGKWISGSGTIDTAGLKADAAPLKSDLMRCAMDAAIAVLTTPVPEQVGAPQSAAMAVDAAQVRAAWSSVRGGLGWPAPASQ